MKATLINKRLRPIDYYEVGFKDGYDKAIEDKKHNEKRKILDNKRRN